MGIFRLSIKKILANPLNAAVSIVLFAIGIGIISLVINAEKRVKEQFLRNLAGIDLVVGAKGSPLQLILSSVFHMDAPTGNISLHEAEQIGRNPLVEKTIPIALGDNYRSFRIVGTTPEYGSLYNATLATGQWFGQPFEAVAGAEAARKTGLTTGDNFTGQHGFTPHGHHHDEDIYTVTGVLNPTGTIIDLLILTTVDTYWLIHGRHYHPEEDEHIHDSKDSSIHLHDEGEDHTEHGHANHSDHAENVDDENSDHEGHVHDENCDHEHDDEEAGWQELISKMDAREELTAEEMALYRSRSGQMADVQPDPGTQITALLVFYSTPRAAVQLPRMINDNTPMQAASPAFETHRLFALAAGGISALRWLAWIIIVISGLNLFIHLSNTLNQGLHEIALIRSLGASRFKVMALLMLQGLWLSLAGWLAGVILSKVILALIPDPGGLQVGTIAALNSHDLLLLAYAAAAGLLSSLIPAIRAYRSDVHYILNNA
jgi:putative ABC transport system permease protein